MVGDSVFSRKVLRGMGGMAYRAEYFSLAMAAKWTREGGRFVEDCYFAAQWSRDRKALITGYLLRLSRNRE